MASIEISQKNIEIIQSNWKKSKLKSDGLEWWTLASKYKYSGRQNGFSVWQYGYVNRLTVIKSKGKSFEHAPAIHSFNFRFFLKSELMFMWHNKYVYFQKRAKKKLEMFSFDYFAICRKRNIIVNLISHRTHSMRFQTESNV